MSRNPIIVEFLGLPGSGKTTLNNRINEIFIKDGVNVACRDDLMRWVEKRSITSKVINIFQNPIWLVYLFNHFKMFAGHHVLKKPSLLKIIVRSANNIIYLDGYIKYSMPSIVLLDQWSVQNIWSAWLQRDIPPERVLKNNVAYIEQFYNKFYIYSAVEPKEAARRICSRTGGGSRLDGFSRKHIERLLETGIMVMNSLISVLNTLGKEILILNGIDPVEKNASLILNWLNSRLD